MKPPPIKAQRKNGNNKNANATGTTQTTIIKKLESKTTYIKHLHNKTRKKAWTITKKAKKNIRREKK